MGISNADGGSSWYIRVDDGVERIGPPEGVGSGKDAVGSCL